MPANEAVYQCIGDAMTTVICKAANFSIRKEFTAWESILKDYIVWSVEQLRKLLALRTDTFDNKLVEILMRMTRTTWREAIKFMFTYIHSDTWKMYTQSTQMAMFQYEIEHHQFILSMKNDHDYRHDFTAECTYYVSQLASWRLNRSHHKARLIPLVFDVFLVLGFMHALTLKSFNVSSSSTDNMLQNFAPMIEGD
jgi:hypothetical protein